MLRLGLGGEYSVHRGGEFLGGLHPHHIRLSLHFINFSGSVLLNFVALGLASAGFGSILSFHRHQLLGGGLGFLPHLSHLQRCLVAVTS